MTKVTAHAKTQRHMALVNKSKRGALTPAEMEELEEFEAHYNSSSGGEGERGEEGEVNDVDVFIEMARMKLMNGSLAALRLWKKYCEDGLARKARQASTTALDGFRMLSMIDARFSEKRENTVRLRDDSRYPLNELLEDLSTKDKKKMLEAMEALEAEGGKEEGNGPD